MDKISVITPCFNAARFIGECLESVRQCVTLGKFEMEHIVVDDGSSDGSPQVLASLDRSDLRLIFLDQNHGQGYARNVGLEAAESEYVFFLDADDLLFQNSLRRLYEAKQDWVYGDFLRGDGEGRYLSGQDWWGWRFRSAGQILAAMYTGRHFFQMNSLYYKEVLDRIEGFDSALRMAEDFDLATRLLLSGHMPVYVPGSLYLHRYHGNNLSRAHLADPGRHRQDVAKLFKKYEGELRQVLSPRQRAEAEKFAMSD